MTTFNKYFKTEFERWELEKSLSSHIPTFVTVDGSFPVSPVEKLD